MSTCGGECAGGALAGGVLLGQLPSGGAALGACRAVAQFCQARGGGRRPLHCPSHYQL